MIQHTGRGAAGAAALALFVAALGARAETPGPVEKAPQNETSEAVKTPESVIRSWPERPRLAARALIEKYGEPDVFDDESLSWAGNRPWDETVVRRSAPAGESIKQSIHYPVSLDAFAAAQSLGGRLAFDPSSQELSSASDSEGLNFLALNLADEIVSGKRTPDEARALYRRTRELQATGKSSPYTEGFLFKHGPRR